jgi:hypothetical protein
MHGLALLASTLLAPAGPDAVPDFDTEVLPVLTRAGCNAGACHGSALGRGGFKLSLWGSNPAADHRAIVRELEGRRINLADPYESLLIQKPTGGVRHGGRIRLEGDGPGVARILAWLEAGAPREGKRRLAHLDVTPEEHVLSRPGESLQIRVTARFNDGTRADATPWAVFQADDPATVQVSEAGGVTVSRRGQATVMVRFLDQVKAVRLLVPVGDASVDLSAAPRHNFIDDEVLATLATLRVPVAEPADDHAFLRRVSLDLTGTLPTPERVRAFAADTRTDKRARLIDELLASEAFVDYWTLKWGDLLRIRSRELGADGVRAFHGWVREQVKEDRPLDAMAREMLLALGDARKVGPANFSRVPRTPREQAEYVSEVFLGVRLRCANCHDHPLDRWRQDDYHGLAAIFARLERGPVVRLAVRGEVIHPRTGAPARMRIPGERFLDAGEDGRKALADWLTGPKNPYFARAAVNRLWKELFGRGLVDPADDLRATNPATHPRLLDRLAEDFVKHGHDVRHTLRLIANSATYQRGAVRAGSVSDGQDPVAERFYARSGSRPLPAAVLADAIASVTGVSDRYGALPEGTRAITLPDPAIPAPGLDVLGRCSREGSCEAETARGGGLARVLHLINGPLLNRKIDAESGRLRQLLGKGAKNADIVEAFYLRALGRPPRARERAYWAEHLPVREDPDRRREALGDFLWALLTCEEFVTNH